MIRTAIKFGAFVALCLSLTLLLAFRIGNIQSASFGPLKWGQQRYPIEAVFDDVTGLIIGDRVKIAGVEVGKVTAISTERGNAVVEMQINDDIAIPDDSKIAVRWRNLIGQRDVYIQPGTSATRLDEGARFSESDTVSVVDLGELFNRLGPIVGAIDPDQVNDFLETVSGALEGNEDALRASIDDLAQLATALASRDQAIGRIIDNTSLLADTVNSREDQISQVLDNLVLLSQTFSENTALLDEALLELGDVGAGLGRLLAANSTEIDQILSNLGVVVDIVDSKLQEGKLETIVTNLRPSTEAVFRIGFKGEFQNQAILCAATSPPNPDGSCPTESGVGSNGTTSAGTSDGRVVGQKLLELLGIGR